VFFFDKEEKNIGEKKFHTFIIKDLYLMVQKIKSNFTNYGDPYRYYFFEKMIETFVEKFGKDDGRYYVRFFCLLYITIYTL
jgi:hypothetical protein